MGGRPAYQTGRGRSPLRVCFVGATVLGRPFTHSDVARLPIPMSPDSFVSAVPACRTGRWRTNEPPPCDLLAFCNSPMVENRNFFTVGVIRWGQTGGICWGHNGRNDWGQTVARPAYRTGRGRSPLRVCFVGATVLGRPFTHADVARLSIPMSPVYPFRLLPNYELSGQS